MANNKQLGNSFETEFAILLYKNNFWALNIKQHASGQPADIIASKRLKTYLIDCKIASTKRGFDLDRIEDNQHYAMTMWLERYGDDGWFAIKYLQDIIMVTHFELEFLRHNGVKTLTYEQAIKLGVPIERWLKERE